YLHFLKGWFGRSGKKECGDRGKSDTGYGSIRFWLGMVQATRWIYCSVWHFFREHDPHYQWTLPYTIP
ncbi:hypothetical protein, partial [Escherichia coli]|uniref:hypothetical protein n=1 Tax=Escherichia coli TaxID=562 RepID=UPI001955374C